MSERRKTYEGYCYFVTFTVVGWVDVFAKARYAEMLVASLNFCVRNKGLNIYAYVIMPNHVHMIASVEKGRLSSVLRDLKSHTSKYILRAIEKYEREDRRSWMLEHFAKQGAKNPQNPGNQFWIQRNHSIEVYNNRIFDQKYMYILNNPVKARLVTKPWHYFWSSAHPDQEVILSEF
jgi:putative transposase